MEGTIIENNSAPSTEVDETNAEGKTAVAAHPQDHEPDFKLIDSLHRALHVKNNKELEEHGTGLDQILTRHGEQLDQILTPSGNTILHIYIISRPPTAAKFVRNVLGKCPNLLQKANRKGEIPLHFAARYGHGDIVEELMEECKQLHFKEQKNDIERNSNDQENCVEPKRLMLKKINEAKDTALHEAARHNHTDVVDKLIEADTELPYDANGSGETPLYLAAERGYKEVVKIILEKCESAADHGPMRRTALHAAVIRRDKDMADQLLAERKDLSREKDELGRFALHYAALLGCDEIVGELLQNYRSAAYQADNDGNTALHLAAGNGKAKAVNKLIEMCPNCCELVDKRGRNALHLALTSADDSTIKIFLEEPALGNLINQKDNGGDTPLLQLANSGSYIRSFISHDKVDKLVFNKENKNAADIILDKDMTTDDQDKFLWKLKTIKDKRCRRIIDPIQEVRGGKVKGSSTISMIRKVKNVQVKDEGSEDTKKKDDDGSEEITETIKGTEETHLVVATLIATVTFAAGFTVPGGYIGGDNPNAGTALLARSAAFQAFVIFDTTAFVLSCASVPVHLTMGLHKDKTQLFNKFTMLARLTSYAMVAMVFAFVTGLYAVSYPYKSLAITACVIGCLFGAHFSAEANGEITTFIRNREREIFLKNMRKAIKTKDDFYSD